jgi:hypothetical protein
MDNISFSLRPCYTKNFTEDERKMVGICKKLENTQIIKNKTILPISFKPNNTKNEYFDYNPDMVCSFVYTYLKKIDITKSVEEFELESGSSDSEYYSDLEYSI